ncbi:nitroreductase family protein [Streptomyces sp. NPDC051554]|uniref:nitroreductase family protein n=1 Tax=Streptomyces sp. NPDC051554 TaxID=3365656 RepID=UPI0037B4579A
MPSPYVSCLVAWPAVPRSAAAVVAVTAAAGRGPPCPAPHHPSPTSHAPDAPPAVLPTAEEEGRTSQDFTDGYSEEGIYLERSQALDASVYQPRGIERSDRDGRRAAVRENLEIYGASHAAFLFMPPLGDGVRTAGDMGMYAQNFLLSLAARGLAGIPQTVLGVYAGTVREFLGVPAELKLLHVLLQRRPPDNRSLPGLGRSSAAKTGPPHFQPDCVPKACP